MKQKTKLPVEVSEKQQQLLNAFNARGSRISKKIEVMQEGIDDLKEKLADWQNATAELINSLLTDKKKLLEDSKKDIDPAEGDGKLPKKKKTPESKQLSK